MIDKLVVLLSIVAVVSAGLVVVGVVGWSRASYYEAAFWARTAQYSAIIGIVATAAAWVLS